MAKWSKKRPALKQSKPSRIGPGVPIYGRRTRAALLVLLLLPVVAAAGLLFIKYKLESFRDTVAKQAEERLGLRFGAKAVEVNGLRGLRVEGFDALFTTPLGPRLRVQAPETFIDIDLIDLFYGQMTVKRVLVEGASFTLSREAGQPWFNAPRGGGLMPKTLSFRVTGRHCTLRIAGSQEETALELRELAFDVSRLPQSPDTVGRIHGLLGKGRGRPVQSTFRYGALEDFDLRVSGAGLVAADVNALLPAGARLAEESTMAPAIRLSGYPDHTLVISVHAPFTNLALADSSLLPPLTGTLSTLASYQLDTHEVKLTSARLESAQMSGDVSGTLSVAQPPGVLDLRLSVEQFPLKEMARQAVQAALGQYGEVDFEIDDPYTIALALRGTLDTPTLSVKAKMEQGSVTFKPIDQRYPAADLRVGMVALSWDSTLRQPVGTLNITGGTLRHGALGLAADDITGTLVLRPGKAILDPLTATVAGNEMAGDVTYDFSTKTAAFGLTGVLADVERLNFMDKLGKGGVKGAVHLSCKGTAAPDQVVVQATVDLTQAEVEYDWFFLKPKGMGASVRDLHIDLKAKQSLTVAGILSAATSTVAFDAALAYRDGTWKPQTVTARSDAVNVLTTGECLRLPYRLSGENATEGTFAWRPSPTGKPGKGEITTSVFFPRISLEPGNNLAPIVCNDARLTAQFDNGPDPGTVSLRVEAREARVPALSSPWLPPFRPEDKELDARFPRRPMVTRYELRADRISLPPWRGTNFEGTGFFSKEQNVIRHFAADIEGGGRLEGSYGVKRAENIGTLDVSWTEIPAIYLLRHMKFPELLTGTMTGEVHYSMDRDDPGTLEGGGRFDIRKGQFSADFVVQLLASQLDADLSALPPSLAFEQLRADVAFDGDKITTSDILLESEGIEISGGGYFILDGDMDYMIDVSISPKTAARIPVLAANLNISGHKATQTDIKLAFHITGPTFSPSGRVAGLPPVGVTLVNGAFTVGGEVVKIIDTPRQILIDLFKIIGGAVGVAKPAGGRK